MPKSNLPDGLAVNSQGQVMDLNTGTVVGPSDPRWNPAWGDFLKYQPPSGQMWVFPNGYQGGQVDAQGNTNPDPAAHGGQLQTADPSLMGKWYGIPLMAALAFTGVGLAGGLSTAGAAGGGAAGAETVPMGGFGATSGTAADATLSSIYAQTAAAGTGAATGAATGSFDAAGNFIGPSTVNDASITGASVISKLTGASMDQATKDLVGQIVNGIIGGVSTGVQVNAANNSAQILADAQNKATAAQLQYANSALDFMKQQYAQGQSNMAPWLSVGGGAMTKLGQLMGVTPVTPAQAALTDTSKTTTTNTGGGVVNGGTGGGGVTGGGNPGSTDNATQGVPMASSVAPPMLQSQPLPSASVSSAPVAASAPAPTSSVAMPAGSSSASDSLQRVKIKWPDGTTNDVPVTQIAQYKALGAQEAA